MVKSDEMTNIGNVVLFLPFSFLLEYITQLLVFFLYAHHTDLWSCFVIFTCECGVGFLFLLDFISGEYILWWWWKEEKREFIVYGLLNFEWFFRLGFHWEWRKQLEIWKVTFIIPFLPFPLSSCPSSSNNHLPSLGSPPYSVCFLFSCVLVPRLSHSSLSSMLNYIFPSSK